MNRVVSGGEGEGVGGGVKFLTRLHVQAPIDVLVVGS